MAVKTVADVSSNGHATVALREPQKPLSRHKSEKAHSENRTRLRFFISVALMLARLIPALRGGKRRSPLAYVLPRKITREGVVLEHHIREGRFQRSLSLITAFSSLVAGLEVTYEHYLAAIASASCIARYFSAWLLFIAGVWGTFNRWVARIVLPIVSLLTSNRWDCWLCLPYPWYCIVSRVDGASRLSIL